MTDALRAFRRVDFNWTRDLQSVWVDPPFHVDDLNGALATELCDDFFGWTSSPGENPIGQVIIGRAGSGKTHLIGELRRRVWAGKGWFVLLDIVGITDFWATTALGFLNSLHQPMPNGRAQYEVVLSTLVKRIPLDAKAREAIARWEKKPDKRKLDTVELFVTLLRRLDPANIARHHDVVRALLLLGSDDWHESNLAYCWLQGLDVDEDDRKQIGFTRGAPPYPELVRGMLWVMSLAGPTLIAVDQIDAIVSASNLLAGMDEEPKDDTERKARAIIDVLAGGLMDLHDVKSGKRALTVVSCLDATWPIIEAKAVKSVLGRFEKRPVIEAIGRGDLVEQLVRRRLEPAYAAAGFAPPYPTWPFRPEAIDSARGLLPRRILMRCHEHRQRCVADGAVSECLTLGEATMPPAAGPVPPIFDREYEHRRSAAPIHALLDPETEDTKAGDLLVDACAILLRHFDLPDDVDTDVQPDPDRRRPSLHARLSFTFRREGDREQHYCFRFLGHPNALAFQSRLKAAMTASGIDRALEFRHLFVLRRGDPPGGVRTKALVDQFLKAGGRFIAPSDDDLRAFVALREMAKRDQPGFDAWLRTRKPLFDTALFKAAGLCPPAFLASSPERPDPGTKAEVAKGRSTATTPAAAKPAAGEPAAAPVGASETGAAPRDVPKPPEPKAAPPSPSGPRLLAIGHRHERGADGDAVSLPAELLPRHVAILAGSGSGKTVLVRRLIEEAALLGVPAIVLDPNNDLSRLGDAWPSVPEGFSSDDVAKAADYRARTEVVIWTPGRSSGNPISLKLLPDFSAIGDDRDEIDQAVEMARATLTPFVAATGASATLKLGVLSAALRRFAEQSGSDLVDLIRLLEDLPEDVSQVSRAQRLAADMADQLHAAMESNPLLRPGATSLDPATLFESPSGKTRISVVNLSGLASDEARDAFVNQLQMTLFTWIKRHPSPSGRLYVLDEAQTFVPSQAGTACKASALSLAAQARKYGLGMMLATQTPKGIDNKIVSNCTTHFYGRMSSPATIEATRELMAAKGGAADDIGRLGRGEFYFSTEGLRRPVKVRTPLCLSFHPANPPTAEEIVEKARAQAG
jgi:hypothetical protein